MEMLLKLAPHPPPIHINGEQTPGGRQEIVGSLEPCNKVPARVGKARAQLDLRANVVGAVRAATVGVENLAAAFGDSAERVAGLVETRVRGYEGGLVDAQEGQSSHSRELRCCERAFGMLSWVLYWLVGVE